MTTYATDKAVKKLLETDFTTVEGGSEWDLWEAYDRIFVSDLPWYERFLIWLFPRMYDIREYKP